MCNIWLFSKNKLNNLFSQVLDLFLKCAYYHKCDVAQCTIALREDQNKKRKEKRKTNLSEI